MIDVLVVDDDFMVARIHRGYVDRLPGFRVVGEAHTAAAALEAVARLAPDLVLLDVYLPDASGLDVLRRLRQDTDCRSDVLAITAARDVETVRTAMHGGVVGYLVKPFAFAAFAERMRRYAEQRRELAGAEEMGQSDVDRLFAGRRTGPAPLPKGLSVATCELVGEALRTADGDLSAAEAAERVGISRVSARRYLEHLAGTGQATLRPRYGGSGRPEHRYSWGGGAPAP